jgi:hypothetical protein
MRKLLLQPNASLNSDLTNKVLGIPSLSLEEGMSRLKARSAALVYAAGS